MGINEREKTEIKIIKNVAKKNNCKVIAHIIKTEIKNGIPAFYSNWYFDKPIFKNK